MTIKELEAWSLSAAHAAAGILAAGGRAYPADRVDHEYVICHAASIADKLLEERRNRMPKGKN
ncbi:MAG: hypothetical protein OXF51_00570 [Alphaproteobacteria bacterium]|nr:hypothetical protein [Alphaproteobacteria bacterium]